MIPPRPLIWGECGFCQGKEKPGNAYRVGRASYVSVRDSFLLFGGSFCRRPLIVRAGQPFVSAGVRWGRCPQAPARGNDSPATPQLGECIFCHKRRSPATLTVWAGLVFWIRVTLGTLSPDLCQRVFNPFVSQIWVQKKTGSADCASWSCDEKRLMFAHKPLFHY